MNNNDKCRSNNTGNSNNVILHGHYRFLQALHESLLLSGRWAVMIHGVPVKTYNALQNHIIVLFKVAGFLAERTVTNFL